MKKITTYILQTVMPIVFVLGIGIVYKHIICSMSSSSEDADFICDMNWKDGFILICSYCVIKFLSPILEFDSMIKRLFITACLYFIAYGFIAFPFILVSFFQPLPVNVFFHAFILIVLVELLFRRLKLLNLI